MLDYINANAPAGNRNILLLSSTSAYNLNSTATAQLISKAKTLGISISTFLFLGDISDFTWDMDHDDIYYRLAYETGGSVYKSRNSIYAGDILDLASPLKNIMNKDYNCFEATWELIPINQYYTTFYPGYFEKPDLEIGLQTGSGKKIFDMPFGIIIK
jgi:hypothetical protein